MKIFHMPPEHMKLSFDLGECTSHVSEDVHNKLEAHSAAYHRHVKVLQALEFPVENLTERQEHNAKFFTYALDKLESVVCDRLWAVSVFSTIQESVAPGFSFAGYLSEYIKHLYMTEEYITALAEVEQSFGWMKMCMEIDSHTRLDQYVQEQFRGLRLVAIGTINHGIAFGRQVLALLPKQGREA